jgi:hypothetical protein
MIRGAMVQLAVDYDLREPACGAGSMSAKRRLHSDQLGARSGRSRHVRVHPGTTDAEWLMIRRPGSARQCPACGAMIMKKEGETSNVVQLYTNCGGLVEKDHLHSELQRLKTRRSGFNGRSTETVVFHAGTAAGTVGGSLNVRRRGG